LDRSHIRDGQDLLGISLDVAFRHDKAKKHTTWDPENTLLGVKLHPRAPLASRTPL
jgi:hypothetical protein